MALQALEDTCEFITDGTHQTPEYCEDGGFLFLSSKDVTSRKIDWDNTKRIPESLHEKLYTRLSPKRDDILLAKNGTTGVAAIVDRDEIFDVYVSLAVLRPKKTIYPPYLLHAINSASVKRQFDAGLKGIGVPNLHLSVIRKAVVNIPTLEEQHEITNHLEAISSIIEHRKKQLEAYDTLIKARFVEMFGSIQENRFPKCKLREVAHIKHGFAFSGEFFSDEDNGVVLVTPGNFALGGGFQEIRNRYFTSDYPDEYVLHSGDLIVTMTDLSKKADTLGYGAIVPETDKVYLHNQRIGLFDRLDQRLNPVFMRWFMQTNEYRLEIVRTATGSTVHHTSPDRILDSMVYLPPIEMQNAFVTFAKQVDKSKVAVQAALNKDQLLFDSLMQQYFG